MDKPLNILDFYYKELRGTERQMQLTPFQESLLWNFYINSQGNEQNRSYPNIPPDGTETKGLDFNSADPYDSLVAVMGRRSGKDYILSIIACYEFYKLVFFPVDYKLAHPEFNILCLCPSNVQAKTLMAQIKNMLVNSLFAQRIPDCRITQNSLTFDQERRPVVKIRCEHLSSTALVGLGIHTLIISEMAAMPHESHYVWGNLTPTVATYRDKDKLNLGKIIMISSPRQTSGAFYDAYMRERKGTLVYRASTWVANPRYTEKTLREEEAGTSDEAFRMDFAAEFIPDDPTEQVTFRIRRSAIERLKTQARKLSYEKDKDVSYTDVLREMVESL